MDKKYAIFDMDGTLVDSMAFWRSLGREYLESKGIVHGIDEALERIKPMTMSESAAFFVKKFALSATSETVEAEMNAMMEEHYRKDIPLKSGIEVYLEKLSGRGVQMCVASATAEDLMDACLARLGIKKYFSFLLSCETVGVGKTEPDVYFESANRLGALPQKIAVYEDALYAAETAKNAGFYTVGVYDENEKKHWKKLMAVANEIISDWDTAVQSL